MDANTFVSTSIYTHTLMSYLSLFYSSFALTIIRYIPKLKIILSFKLLLRSCINKLADIRLLNNHAR